MVVASLILFLFEVIICLILVPLISGVVNLWFNFAVGTGLVRAPVEVLITIKPLYNPLLADHAMLSLVQQKSVLQNLSDCSTRCSDQTFLNSLKNDVDTRMKDVLPSGKDYHLTVYYPKELELGNVNLKTQDVSEFTLVAQNFKYKNMLMRVG
ncbi:MAG: hypothetical protein NTW30_01560 [Candidatus Aenigmarchaeota archaeon]|nr:hypothetical protein [Candidatus Aenigmarchaeota archaeon]